MVAPLCASIIQPPTLHVIGRDSPRTESCSHNRSRAVLPPSILAGLQTCLTQLTRQTALACSPRATIRNPHHLLSVRQNKSTADYDCQEWRIAPQGQIVRPHLASMHHPPPHL